MTGFGAMAGAAGEAGPRSGAGHCTASGAGGLIAERRVRALGIVQLDDRTPTGPRSASFSIRGILGRGARSTFMR